MAKELKRRIRSEDIKQDRAALAALQGIRNYQPRNPDHGVQALIALSAAVEESRQAKVDVQKQLTDARNRMVDDEWKLHNAMLNVKAEVVVQFGADSEAIKAVGLKKKSERKHPKRAAVKDARSD